MRIRQLSLRGFDDELDRRIRERARREGISLNRAALQLLRKGAGLDEKGNGAAQVGNSLDHLIGTWADGERRDFDKSIEALEQIDASFWK